MNVTLAYWGQSGLRNGRGPRTLSLAPNLTRDPVALDAALKNPLRFREGISALHDVVINDLRFKPRDKSAYEAWRQSERARLANLRREEYKQAKAEVLARRGDVPPDLERQYHAGLRRYWSVRQQYSNYLLRHDQSLWRMLMPCDPVITVADDVVFFECFSTDESSYGCLTVDRDDCFGPSDAVQFGTTNVDYSWDLYHHFQTLRTYRETRFLVDPSGFEVAVQGAENYREEKIDLPPGWLRGFMQIQAAMSLPMRRVTLSREAVYSVLAWLRRHKARSSPRRCGSNSCLTSRRRWCWSRGNNKSLRTPRATRVQAENLSAFGAGDGCWCCRGCCRWPTRSMSSCWEPACRVFGWPAWARCG